MDSTAGIALSIQEAAREMGLPVPAREAASHVIGLGLHDSLRAAVPSLPVERYLDFVDLYRKHFQAQQETMALFEGVPDLLESLRSRGHQRAGGLAGFRQGDALRSRVLRRTRAGLRAALPRPRVRLPEPLRPSADGTRLARGRSFRPAGSRFDMLDARRDVRGRQRQMPRRTLRRHAAGGAAGRGEGRQGVLQRNRRWLTTMDSGNAG